MDDDTITTIIDGMAGGGGDKQSTGWSSWFSAKNVLLVIGGIALCVGVVACLYMLFRRTDDVGKNVDALRSRVKAIEAFVTRPPPNAEVESVMTRKRRRSASYSQDDAWMNDRAHPPSLVLHKSRKFSAADDASAVANATVVPSREPIVNASRGGGFDAIDNDTAANAMSIISREENRASTNEAAYERPDCGLSVTV